MKTKVLFLWDAPTELQDYIRNGLRDTPDVSLLFPVDISGKSLCSLVNDVDITVGWRPSETILNHALKLSLHINPGAGVRHLIELFRGFPNVTLINGHGNSRFAAQHTVALLLALTNKLIEHHTWMADGNWRMGDNGAKSMPLQNKNIGLFGYGAINRKVHGLLKGFDLEFHILKRDWSSWQNISPPHDKRYSPKDLNSFLEKIDILIIAAPLTSETEQTIGPKELKLLGTKGLLVNVSRGSIIEEKPLFDSLKNGIIAGAAIDVWYEYHPEMDGKGKKYPYHYPFHELDNIILSPHRGASPYDDFKRWDEVIENIIRHNRGDKVFLNTVNLDREY